jgi:hypothetical protein
MPSPESAAAFAKLVEARTRLNEISAELREAMASRKGVLVDERIREIQGRWEAALDILEKAASKYSAELTRLREEV